MEQLYEQLNAVSPVSVVIIAIGIMLAVGVFVTRFTGMLRLPNVTAYILTGVFLGPFCTKLVPTSVAKGMDFIPDIALAFIAFSAGEFFKLSTLRANGTKVILITLFESLVASVLIFILTFFILHLGLPFSIILAALASATAPASTLMTIRQTGAKGDFVNTLLSVVALDDVVSLVAFSVAVSVAIASLGGSFSMGDIVKPFLLNIVMVAIGALLGLLLKFRMAHHGTDNRLIVAIAILFAICGLGAAIGVSPLLGCMTIGMVYINTTEDERLFKQLNYFSPPILLLFFVKSGIEFRLNTLLDVKSAVAGTSLLLIGVLYFIVRIVGKYAGAFTGCMLCKTAKEQRNYLGLALIPQAGVSIGLAALGARLLGGETGANLQTIILSSSILYELVGPACAKLSLFLSHSYDNTDETREPTTETREPTTTDATEPTPLKSDVSTLKEQLQAIQVELEQKEYSRSAEELAFNQAADETEETMSTYDYLRRHRTMRNRR